MPDAASLIGFIAASLVVLLLPGPGVLYVVAQSSAQGVRAGLVSALGLSAGAMVHVIAATAGLSAVLIASATAYGIVKLAGAAYLIYLGVRMLTSRGWTSPPKTAGNRPVRRVFADGVLVSVFNPKIAVFFLAYLPQFVDPARGPVAQQVFLLGATYSLLAIVTDGSYALVTGGLRTRLQGRTRWARWPRALGGGLLIALGVRAALAER